MAMTRRKQQEQFVQNMVKNSRNGTGPPCRFSAKEIYKLLRIFKNHAGPNGKIDRPKFRDQLHNSFHITDDFLMDRIFKAFDRDNDGALKADEYVWGLSVFLKGEIEDKVKFCFAIYDINGDGHISREEMFHLLKTSLVKQSSEEDPDENSKEMVEIVFKKLDMNHDGRCDLSDFREAVQSDSLLLESLGQCLPNDDDKEAFLALLS